MLYDRSSSNHQIIYLNASVEKKLNQSVSLYIVSSNGLSHYKSSNQHFTANIGNISLGGRYYFMKKKQILQGVSGNNLNGLFIDMRANSFLSYLHYAKNSKSEYIDDLRKFNHGLTTENLGLWAGLGVQKKIK